MKVGVTWILNPDQGVLSIISTKSYSKKTAFDALISVQCDHDLVEAFDILYLKLDTNSTDQRRLRSLTSAVTVYSAKNKQEPFLYLSSTKNNALLARYFVAVKQKRNLSNT